MSITFLTRADSYLPVTNQLTRFHWSNSELCHRSIFYYFHCRSKRLRFVHQQFSSSSEKNGKIIEFERLQQKCSISHFERFFLQYRVSIEFCPTPGTSKFLFEFTKQQYTLANVFYNVNLIRIDSEKLFENSPARQKSVDEQKKKRNSKKKETWKDAKKFDNVEKEKCL